MASFIVNRRSLLKGAAGGALALSSGVLPFRQARADGLTIGIVYVGPRDDFGWNQAHAVAAAALKEVPGVTVVEEENVPETVAVSKTMESMIELDGAKLIFATSFGYYAPFVVDAAKKYPDVQFRHAAPLWSDKDPKNAGSYFGYLDQAHFIDGVAAGLSTKTNKLGFVAAKPISSVLSNINSFTLGAKKVNPNITTQVIFTGDWALPVREAEATNALVDAGCDVITCHVDSPKTVIQNAEAKGVKTCGHNASRRRWRRRASSPAPSTNGRRSTRATPTRSPRAARCPTCCRAAMTSTSSRTLPTAPARARKPRLPPRRPRPTSRPRSRSMPAR
jgi:simple sugar transport system substrate-binding protein